jgi:hypothetical protein
VQGKAARKLGHCVVQSNARSKAFRKSGNAHSLSDGRSENWSDEQCARHAFLKEGHCAWQADGRIWQWATAGHQ